jgi:hypothetical protein
MTVTGKDPMYLGSPRGAAPGEALAWGQARDPQGGAQRAFATAMPAPPLPGAPGWRPDLEADAAVGTRIVTPGRGKPVRRIRGGAAARNVGFAPHGAGRHLSRAARTPGSGTRSQTEVFAREAAGPDVRFWSGNLAGPELRGACRPAATVCKRMARTVRPSWWTKSAPMAASWRATGSAARPGGSRGSGAARRAARLESAPRDRHVVPVGRKRSARSPLRDPGPRVGPAGGSGR